MIRAQDKFLLGVEYDSTHQQKHGNPVQALETVACTYFSPLVHKLYLHFIA